MYLNIDKMKQSLQYQPPYTVANMSTDWKDTPLKFNASKRQEFGITPQFVTDLKKEMNLLLVVNNYPWYGV